MIVDKKDFPYVMKHNGYEGCGEVAFYLSRNDFNVGDVILANEVMHLNGKPGIRLEKIKCDSCEGVLQPMVEYIEKR